MKTKTDRRRHQRYTLEPMYAPIAARVLEGGEGGEGGEGAAAGPVIEGNAYDISVGGMRFDLDRALPTGTRVAMQVTLPTGSSEDVGPGRSVLVFATVVWTEDADEPGPVRTAAAFTGFARLGDRERLLRQFASGRYRLAA